jgi:hypothetical protein
MVVLTVGGMTGRRDVRILSARIADLDGVVALEVELEPRVQVREGLGVAERHLTEAVGGRRVDKASAERDLNEWLALRAEEQSPNPRRQRLATCDEVRSASIRWLWRRCGGNALDNARA